MRSDWRRELKHHGRTIAAGHAWQLGGRDDHTARKRGQADEQLETTDRVKAWFDRREAQRMRSERSLQAAHEARLEDLAHERELARVESGGGSAEVKAKAKVAGRPATPSGTAQAVERLGEDDKRL
jgi:hypothetical protein